MKRSNWHAVDQLLVEIIEMQRIKLLECGRRIVPNLTDDDLLQPNDFLILENHPAFRYEEGLLAGLQSAQMAIRALERDQLDA